MTTLLRALIAISYVFAGLSLLSVPVVVVGLVRASRSRAADPGEAS